MMMKKQGTSRNGFFFLVGVFVYSLFFWLTGNNYTHVFGMILIGLASTILYKMDYKMTVEKEWIKTKDIIYMCVGAVFDSLSSGFPFNILSR
jgi:hypothetical protein